MDFLKNETIMNNSVEFGKDYKGKKCIIVHSDDEKLNPVEYLILRWRQAAVREGDILIEGNKDPHDILKVLGLEEKSS